MRRVVPSDPVWYILNRLMTSIWVMLGNDVALHDCQKCRIGRPYRDAQDRLLWKDKTCPART